MPLPVGVPDNTQFLPEVVRFNQLGLFSNVTVYGCPVSKGTPPVMSL